MAIKYFPATTPEQESCKHTELTLVSAQKIDNLYSVNYKCVCGIKVQTDGKEAIDKKNMKEIDKIATPNPID